LAAQTDRDEKSKHQGRAAVRGLAWLEPFWVLVLGAALLLPQRFVPAMPAFTTLSWRPLLIALLFIGWPVRALAYGRLSRSTPLDWPFLLLGLCIFIGLWASADRAASWVAASYQIFGLALYFALLNWPPTARRPELVAWPLMALGLGIALVSPLMSRLTVAQFSHLPVLGALLPRLGPQQLEDVNINVLAGSVVLILPLFVSMGLRPGWKRPWLKLLLALGALLMLAVILITRSRGAYLAAAAGIAVVILLRWPRLAYAVPLFVLAGVIGLAAIGPARVVGVGGWVLGTADGSLGGLSGRAEVWSRAIYALHDFSLTGIGLGTFSRVIPLMYPYLTLASESTVEHAHNLLLQVGLDLGIPGLIAYLAVLIDAFALLAAALRRRDLTGSGFGEDGLRWGLAAGAVGGLVAMLVHGLVDAALWRSRPAFLVWVLIALSVLVGLRALEVVPATDQGSRGQDAARSGSTPDRLAATS
jgi:putative inorganic carbon (HCO3(-)) transporter